MNLYTGILLILFSFGFSFPNNSVNYTIPAVTMDLPIVTADLFSSIQPTFHPDYQEDIEKAIEFLQLHQQAIQPISHNRPDLCRKTIAVVFPELIRYNRFRDLLETAAVEHLYVRFGSQTADYSIGPFQMKPSFIEKLEKYVSDRDCLAHQFERILLSTELSDEAQRKTRVERLKSFSWQLMYALAYVEIMEQSPPFTLPPATDERLHLIATAYNYGFDRPVEAIKGWQEQVAFPYGLQYPIPQFPYADLSVHFFHNSSNLQLFQ